MKAAATARFLVFSIRQAHLEYIVVSVLNGVVHGLLLFMVSAGLTLIFGMMGVLNFAHAWFYMLGAYVGFTLTRLGGFWVGLVLAPFVAGLTGVLVERYMLRRVHKYGHAHELLLTFGLAFIIEEVIKLFYGDALVSYQMPDYMRFAAFTIFDTNYPFYRLFMGAVALAMFAVLYLLLTRTRVGIVVRAATYRPTTVEALGHNLPLVFMGVFAGGSALAGLAGAVAGAFYPTGPSMAVDFGTLVFVVVVVGGLGSVVGALVASLMIGLFISFSVGLNVSIADLLGLFGLGRVGRRSRRAVHPAAVDRRQQHAVPAHAADPAHPPGRPDGRSPVIKTRTIVLLLARAGRARPAAAVPVAQPAQCGDQDDDRRAVRARLHAGDGPGRHALVRARRLLRPWRLRRVHLMRAVEQKLLASRLR